MGWPWLSWAGGPPPVLGDGERFSFSHLITLARARAGVSYVRPASPHGHLLDSLGYEVFMGIKARREQAYWHDTDLPFRIEFFPLDSGSRIPVEINTVIDGRIQRIDYDPTRFRFTGKARDMHLPADLGHTGFRLIDARTDNLEWLAFKGASYFRSPGTDNQYGMSARGVAIDTALDRAEAFPTFTRYWIEQPHPDSDTITIWALLEGEHLTGAYAMRCQRPGDVIMDIQCRLFPRRPIERLGIAPLTSMFWFSETNARRGPDWRPEVHDSDGLAIATGTGERLWRALANPPRADLSLFADHSPRGFGLVQRDRVFDHYQDAAVAFERRPSTWVEPAGDWGAGHIALFELPTNDEIYDNINAFWIPAQRARAQEALAFDYRLSWLERPAFVDRLASVVATRTGRAGDPQTFKERTPIDRKFVIDFVGPPLGYEPPGEDVQIEASASYGAIDNPYVIAIGGGEPGWRVFIDWRGEPAADELPAVLRCRLRRRGQTLTETWLYSYYPRPLPA